MARWYVQHPGAQPVGPADAMVLREAWVRQQVPPNTVVCAEGSSQWVPFHTVAELVGASTTRPLPGAGVPPLPGKPSPERWSLRKRTTVRVALVGFLSLFAVAVYLNQKTSLDDFDPSKLTDENVDAQCKSLCDTMRTAWLLHPSLWLDHSAFTEDCPTNCALAHLMEHHGELFSSGAKPAATPLSQGDVDRCRSACFTRRVHQLEAQGKSANTEPGGPGLIDAECEKDCREGRE
jgi:hypothetical protein